MSGQHLPLPGEVGEAVIVCNAGSALTADDVTDHCRKVLARYKGDPVLVRQGKTLIATFHPELSADRRLQKLFLEGC